MKTTSDVDFDMTPSSGKRSVNKFGRRHVPHSLLVEEADGDVKYHTIINFSARNVLSHRVKIQCVANFRDGYCYSLEEPRAHQTQIKCSMEDEKRRRHVLIHAHAT